ncbi:hypothetical protein H5410_061143 [Solanum commersonii]|uniref:Uncharacterized protein n=1 Tax=Solanum commersonii TaxID=4109 RepID=A0A9J5W7C2_SOLCO|nr:hypothetical protein H5410_061143 [Solanum commersonii]
MGFPNNSWEANNRMTYDEGKRKGSVESTTFHEDESQRRNEGLRIAESTWRVAEGSYFAFCSSVLSPEGKDQVDGDREQSVHRQKVPRSSTMLPNDPEHTMLKAGARRQSTTTKGESPS